MDVGRIWTLMGKEVRLGATNFLTVYVLVMPVVITLLVALVFGDLFAQTPRLGIYDAGNNARFTQPLLDHDSINTTVFHSDAALQAAVERGQVEVGVSLPAGFVDALEDSAAPVPELHFYTWGEIGVRSAILLDSVVARALVDGTGVELPAQVHPIQLGAANTATWAQRLLPLLLVMAVVLGGLFIPASSLVEEKEKGTLIALTTSPTSLLDVYLSKTLLGLLTGAAMALIILALNRAISGQIGLLLTVIALGALMNAVIGSIMGSLSKDMDSFLAMIKAFGLVLYAPGILQIFPQVPEWISRLFPTFYIVNPVLEISQNGAGFADIALELGILVAIVGGLLFVLARIVQRQRKQLLLIG